MAIAERGAARIAEPPAKRFPETPRPGFAAECKLFQAALSGLLASLRERRRGVTSGGGGGRTC